jgi:DNA-binding beta-propeller fold protein YncE
VWVTSELDDRLARIDPSTNRITAVIPAGKGAGAVAVGAGSVWVADEVGGTITRIDPRTLRVVGTTKLDSIPVDLAVGGGEVWVAARQREPFASRSRLCRLFAWRYSPPPAAPAARRRSGSG